MPEPDRQAFLRQQCSQSLQGRFRYVGFKWRNILQLLPEAGPVASTLIDKRSEPAM